MMRLLSVALLRERVTDWLTYPFVIPAIRTLEKLEFRSRICFFVGENGSGKSTLLEAIATQYGFGLEGGGRNFHRQTTESLQSVAPLSKALRVAFTKRTGKGFYLRAESFFNVASEVDQMARDDPASDALAPYGGISLHQQSHGESFLALLENRFFRKGFYVLDEPEAALSPQRQITMLGVLRDLLEDNEEIQFLIATHSPILLAYPGAQIFSFDDGVIREITYRETNSYQVMARFLARPEVYIREIFEQGSSGPDEDA
ncbi:MAG TPA: AAA family ATPase [Bryobacteraceae bacterium]|jgi:predicted ATPase